MGVVASEIEADEVVTSPAMISHKHPQGGPRPPNTPLQELTQELSCGTKQVMLWGHRTLLHRGPLMVVVPYHTMAHLKFMVPYLTTPSFMLGIIGTVHLFTCSSVGPFFSHAVDTLFFIFVVDALSIKN